MQLSTTPDQGYQASYSIFEHFTTHINKKVSGTVLDIYLGLNARKHVFGGLLTTKAQTSLCIRAVWNITFVIHLLKDIIYRRATSKISIF